MLPIGSENFEKFFFIIYYLVFIIIFLDLKFKIKKNGYFNEKKSEQWNFLMMATIFEKKRGDCSSYSGECFDKISSDNKDYLLPQFAYKYNLVSWLSSLRWRPSLSSSRGEICQTYPDNYNFSHIHTALSFIYI